MARTEQQVSARGKRLEAPRPRRSSGGWGPAAGGRPPAAGPLASGGLALALLAGGLGSGCGGGGLELRDGRLVITPDHLELGAVPVGLAGRATFELRNDGAGLLVLEGVLPNAELSGEVVVEALPAALAPAEVYLASATFRPRAPGPRLGVLTFTTRSSATPVVELPVSGRAVEPQLSVSPEVVDLGRVVLGRARTATVSLQNRGLGEVVITHATRDLSTSPELSASLAGSLRLGPQDRAELRVTYTPADLGIDEGRIVIADDSQLPTRPSVVVRGEGIAAELLLEPSELHFSGCFVGETRVLALDLVNLGREPRVIEELTLEETIPTGELALVPPAGLAPPFELGPGQEVRLFVRYSPTDTLPDAGRARVRAHGLAPVVAELSAQADVAPAPSLAVEPAALGFGPVLVGAASMRAVRIDNRGTSELHLTPPEVAPSTAPYRVIGAPVPATLAPGESHTVVVALEPEVVGAVPAAELVVSGDDPTRPVVRVPLSGEGSAVPIPELRAEEGRVTFGRVPRGVAATRVLLVSSVGTRALAITEIALVDDGAGRFRSAPAALPRTLEPGEHLAVLLTYADPTGLRGARAGVLEIESDDPRAPVLRVPLDAETTGPLAPAPALELELTWDSGGADLDLHLIRPGGAFFDRPSDACRCASNPDWGEAGEWTDDPWLESERAAGPGPERLVLEVAAPGEHRVVVDHAGAVAGSSPVTEVRLVVRSAGGLLGTFTRRMASGQRWEAGVFVPGPPEATFLPGGVPLSTAGPRTCY